MDKASAPGAGDSRFESWAGQGLLASTTGSGHASAASLASHGLPEAAPNIGLAKPWSSQRRASPNPGRAEGEGARGIRRAHMRVCFQRIQRQMTAVGFEPMPFRNGALSHHLRPLGQTVLTLHLPPHQASASTHGGWGEWKHPLRDSNPQSSD